MLGTSFYMKCRFAGYDPIKGMSIQVSGDDGEHKLLHLEVLHNQDGSSFHDGLPESGQEVIVGGILTANDEGSICPVVAYWLDESGVRSSVIIDDVGTIENEKDAIAVRNAIFAKFSIFPQSTGYVKVGDPRPSCLYIE